MYTAAKSCAIDPMSDVFINVLAMYQPWDTNNTTQVKFCHHNHPICVNILLLLLIKYYALQTSFWTDTCLPIRWYIYRNELFSKKPYILIVPIFSSAINLPYCILHRRWGRTYVRINTSGHISCNLLGTHLRFQVFPPLLFSRVPYTGLGLRGTSPGRGSERANAQPH